jgi:transcription elongation factor Elf1
MKIIEECPMCKEEKLLTITVPKITGTIINIVCSNCGYQDNDHYVNYSDVAFYYKTQKEE